MEKKARKNGTLKGFLQNNRRAPDWWDCIWLPVAPGVLGSLSHFRRSSGAVPPWAPCRWAHVWRNEPRAITRSFSPCVCRLLRAFCLPLPASPSLHLLHLSLSPPFPSCISFLSPRCGCVLGLQSLCRGGRGTRREARRNELTETPKAHLKLVLLENLPVHAPPRRWWAHDGEVVCFGGVLHHGSHRAAGVFEYLHSERLRLPPASGLT